MEITRKEAGGMTVQDFFPMWGRLEQGQQARLLDSAQARTVARGTILHSGDADCTGLLLVRSGQLRAYIRSDEGREITIYRLFDRDLCLFSASCILRSIQFAVTIQAEQDTDLWVLPAEVYQALMAASAPLANYTNELMAGRFSEVMWLLEQVLWRRMDRRLAAFLLEESAIQGGAVLKITHEAIANHLGTHREVITRMLRYFQTEGMVRISRGAVELLDQARLRRLGEDDGA